MVSIVWGFQHPARTTQVGPQALKATVEEPVEVAPLVVSPKEELMSVVSTVSPIGSVASESLRSSVLELLTKLEPSNPTEAPATSPLLNGIWDVAYSGYAPGPLASPTRPVALFLYAGGYTPGLAGLSLLRMLPDSLVDVGGLEIKISRDQPRVEASTTVTVAGAGARDVKVRTTLDAETAIRLKESYATFELAGRALDIPNRLRYSRKLFVTYLDDDLLVVRDESGVPDLLLRKSFPDWLEDDNKPTEVLADPDPEQDKPSETNA